MFVRIPSKFTKITYNNKIIIIIKNMKNGVTSSSTYKKSKDEITGSNQM